MIIYTGMYICHQGMSETEQTFHSCFKYLIFGFGISLFLQDFYSLEELPGQAQSFILDSGVRVKFVGGKFRTFKPGTNIDCYVSLKYISLIFLVSIIYRCNIQDS